MVSPPPSQVLTVSHYDLEVFETAAWDHSFNCTSWLRKFLRPPSSSGVESRNASPSHNRWVSTGHSLCASEKLSQVQCYSKGQVSPPTEQSRMLHGCLLYLGALAPLRVPVGLVHCVSIGTTSMHNMGTTNSRTSPTTAECQLQSTSGQHQCATC